jgi:hypothetical protein
MRGFRILIQHIKEAKRIKKKEPRYLLSHEGVQFSDFVTLKLHTYMGKGNVKENLCVSGGSKLPSGTPIGHSVPRRHGRIFIVL